MSWKIPHAFVALLASMALFSPSGSSQEYTVERAENLGIEFRLHKKLSRSQAPYAGRFPRYHLWYEPEDVGDSIHTKYGAFNWYMFVLEFPKDLEGVPDRSIFGRNFREWATSGDPNLTDREILVENRRSRPRRGQLAHGWWEFRDQLMVSIRSRDRFGDVSAEQVKQPLHYVAAVYDLPDRQIALVGVIPVKDYRTFKPDDRFKGYLTTMVTSLKVTGTAAPAAEDMSPRDSVLSKAKTLAESTQGWDYIPGESYAVLYSWDPKRDARKRDSERFAKKVSDTLERMRELYAQELPTHPKQVRHFPTVRICYDYEDFLHSAGTSEQGAVAAFNRNLRETVIYHDRDRERARNERELLAAATTSAWQQFANFYFFVGTDVDLHRWYEMGLAAWFGSHHVSGRRINYTPDRELSRTIRAAVQRGNYLGFEEFLSADSNQFDGPGAEQHVAQAFALVDFLKRGPEEQKDFDQAWAGILDTYRKNALENRSPRRALAAAIEGIDLVALEAAWLEWVKTELR